MDCALDSDPECKSSLRYRSPTVEDTDDEELGRNVKDRLSFSSFPLVCMLSFLSVLGKRKAEDLDQNVQGQSSVDSQDRKQVKKNKIIWNTGKGSRVFVNCFLKINSKPELEKIPI